MQNSEKSFEQEAAQQIIYMHDVLGYGFRKISEKLKSQEMKISKDKAWRLYHKYRERIEFKEDEEDDELTQIKKEERELTRRLSLTKEKEARRKKIATLVVDEADSSYEKRKKIFIYRDKMMEFARKIMPVLHPQIWDEFQLSLHDRDYTLEDALILVFGQQRHYEKQTVNGTNQRPKLDVYLCQRIKDRLDAWKDEKRKPEIEEIVDEEEYFVIPIWQY